MVTDARVLRAALVEFLRARLDKDERAARSTPRCTRHRGTPPTVATPGHVRADAPNFPYVTELDQDHAPEGRWVSEFLDHIAAHDPARTLRTVAVGRAMLEDYEEAERYCADTEFGMGRRFATIMALTRLAETWADHPDFIPEWRP